MKKLALLLTLLATGCTDPDGAVKVLSDNGFSNIKTGGYGWLSCSSKEDVYKTEFTTSPNGSQLKEPFAKDSGKAQPSALNDGVTMESHSLTLDEACAPNTFPVRFPIRR
jgi:hypothetical protein